MNKKYPTGGGRIFPSPMIFLIVSIPRDSGGQFTNWAGRGSAPHAMLALCVALTVPILHVAS